jgi:uncharacterized protein YbaA (DUF1428 family)
MNVQKYKGAFGKAPESFKSRVAFTLTYVEEKKKMKKFSIRLILIAGIILILMAGVVYAASIEWKLLDAFSARYEREPSERLKEVMKSNSMSKSYDAGEYLVTLEEAVADGKLMYITANVRMKDEEEVYFLPMRISSFMRIGDVVGSHYDVHMPSSSPLEYNQIHTEKMGQQTTAGDERSFRQAAMEDKKRMINIILWFSYSGRNNERASFTILPDGSVSFVLAMNVPTDKKTADVELNLFVREVNESGNYVGENVQKSFPLSLPIMPVLEAKTVDAHDTKIEGTDIVVDRMELSLTPLALHYELYFSSPSDLSKQERPFFYFSFRNEQGEPIDMGLGLGIRVKPLNDTQYVQSGSLSLEHIPDMFYMKGYMFDEKLNPVKIGTKAKSDVITIEVD